MPLILIPVYIALAAAAIYGVESSRRMLVMITKPLATILLIFIAGWPSSRLSWSISIGILLSFVGDIALLKDSKTAFIVGLGFFLLAHMSYVTGFLSVVGWSPSVLAYGTLIAAATALLLRRIWANTTGLRIPVVIYAIALSSMAVSAFATTSGILPPAAARLAAAGGLLFYISDSSLAFDKFARPINHVEFLTMGVYWLGQLGIALASRG